MALLGLSISLERPTIWIIHSKLFSVYVGKSGQLLQSTKYFVDLLITYLIFPRISQQDSSSQLSILELDIALIVALISNT
jgi:hypothetical protein